MTILVRMHDGSVLRMLHAERLVSDGCWVSIDRPGHLWRWRAPLREIASLEQEDDDARLRPVMPSFRSHLDVGKPIPQRPSEPSPDKNPGQEVPGRWR